MKNRYLFPLFVLLVSSFVFISCDNDEEDDREYMTGSVTFEFPRYCLVGATIEAYCSGITVPDDVTYYWVSTTLLEDTLFSQKAVFQIPDSAGVYTVNARARAEGYYQSASSASVTAIDPDIHDGSITGLKVSEKTFVDSRDHHEYHYVRIGKLDWMTENLAYAGTEENPVGVGLYKEDLLRDIFGSLYSWNDATGGVAGSGLGQGPQGVCPEGWSVPTKEDWVDLAATVNAGDTLSFANAWEGIAPHLTVEAYFNETKMWPYAPKFEKKNTYGWNALPCGHCTDKYTRFRHLMEYGMWWSSADEGDKGLYRYIYYNTTTMPSHAIDKDDFAASVRCVRLTN